MERYKEYLDTLVENQAIRKLRNPVFQGNLISEKQREMLNLSSNDYLGLGCDRTLWKEFTQSEEFREDSEYFPGSACSSRLLTGNHSAYTSLEKKLTTLYGSEAALVLNSGYHANLGILPALAFKKDLIIADKLVHASLIDGIRLSFADSVRYTHNDLDRLESILDSRRNDYEHVFIVTESIFSMDGDCSDLPRLIALKKKYAAFLYLDEAHAVGVRGPNGLGLAEECGCIPEIDFLVGTFGKAIASQGAFLISSGLIKEYLVNTMRPLIYSTALPPWNLKWTEYVLDHLSAMKDRRRSLHSVSNLLRNRLGEIGMNTSGESQIVPIYMYDNEKAVRISEYLREHGFYVLPIRSPTVPPGSERLRISLNASVTPEQIETFIALCKPIAE